VALTLGLAACGGDGGGEAAPPPAEEPAPAEPPAEEPAPAEPPAEEPAAVEPIKIALDFTPNTNHSGIYVALANGYFEEQGIAAEVIPYAFGTPPTGLVASGEADLAVGFPPDVAIQVSTGADLKIVSEIIQVNNAALVTLVDSPLTGPADFGGKKYGGYGTPHEAPVVTAILEGAGANPTTFEEVILSTGAIEALTSGDVDFSAVYEGWSEIGAEIAGSPLNTFPYKDYVEGYIFPDVVFVTSGALIEEKGDTLRRALAALAQGYAFAAESPAETAEILTTQVPELGQSQELVSRSAEFRAPQYLDANGTWGCLREEQFTGVVDLLADAGVIADPPAFADYGTNELLEGC
jgi:ABC-type nitrate/sulfonate/bicarbonate transport system substrate-binding protein